MQSDVRQALADERQDLLREIQHGVDVRWMLEPADEQQVAPRLVGHGGADGVSDPAEDRDRTRRALRGEDVTLYGAVHHRVVHLPDDARAPAA